MLIDNHKNKPFASMQSGFALLEVLITVVIVSIGLLGLAGLQVTALNYSHAAYQRSQATALAYDIIDRIRANTSSVNIYSMDKDDADLQSSCFNTVDGGCSAALMAQHDVKEWNDSIANILPEGFGTIPPPVAGLYKVTITWTEKVDAEVVSFDVSFTLE